MIDNDCLAANNIDDGFVFPLRRRLWISRIAISCTPKKGNNKPTLTERAARFFLEVLNFLKVIASFLVGVIAK